MAGPVAVIAAAKILLLLLTLLTFTMLAPPKALFFSLPYLEPFGHSVSWPSSSGLPHPLARKCATFRPRGAGENGYVFLDQANASHSQSTFSALGFSRWLGSTSGRSGQVHHRVRTTSQVASSTAGAHSTSGQVSSAERCAADLLAVLGGRESAAKISAERILDLLASIRPLVPLMELSPKPLDLGRSQTSGTKSLFLSRGQLTRPGGSELGFATSDEQPTSEGQPLSEPPEPLKVAIKSGSGNLNPDPVGGEVGSQGEQQDARSNRYRIQGVHSLARDLLSQSWSRGNVARQSRVNLSTRTNGRLKRHMAKSVHLRRRSSSYMANPGTVAAVQRLIYWPPPGVLRLAQLAAANGGAAGSILDQLGDWKFTIPDVEGSTGARCQLGKYPWGRRFRDSSVTAYLAFLFEAVALLAPGVGLPVALTRFDLFHAHLFVAKGTGRLGALFHAREYPAYSKDSFPIPLGFCQAGSPVPYDSSMNLRNLLWLAPLPQPCNETAEAALCWTAPGTLLALDATPGTTVYKEMVPEYLEEVRTIYEGDSPALTWEGLFGSG